MKRILLPQLLVVLLIIFLVPNAKAKFSTDFGIKVGLNFSEINAKNIKSNIKIGAIGGVAMQLNFRFISLQPEFLYTMKGFNVKGLDENIILDYIEIPLLFKYNITTNSLNPNIFLGPAVAFNVRARALDNSDLKDWIKSKDFSIVGGCGFALKIGMMSITGEVRATVGITDTYDTNHPMVIDGGRNIVFSFLSGIMFSM